MAFDIKIQSKRTFEELWNQGQLGYLDEHFDPGFTSYEPLMGKLDREGFKKAVQSYRQAFPDLRFEVKEVIGEGELCAVRWSATGTHKGTFQNLPATGKKVTVTGLSLVEYRNGRVMRDHTQWDVYGLMRELGGLGPQPEVTGREHVEARH